MARIEEITLESLLNPQSELYVDPADALVSDDPAEVAIECMDILDELHTLQGNLLSYEAAKAVKKAKSASKKKKIVKTKMKAKDAKAKLKDPKTLKVKKVTKESDAATDGGTGPLPTTADTNGLTETDLDVDPDAEVEVSEVSDETLPDDNSANAAATEGVDFWVEYEDAGIVTLEANVKENLKKFGEAIVKMLKAVADFFVSIGKKFIGIFQNVEQYYKTNKAAVDAGFTDGFEMQSKFKLDAGVLAKIGEAIKTQMDSAVDTGEEQKTITGLFTELGENGKVTNKDCGFSSGNDIVGCFNGTVKKAVNDCIAAAKKKGAEKTAAAKKAADSGNKEEFIKIKKDASNMQRSASTLYKEYGKAAAYGMKILHAAAAAGSKKAPAAK